MPVVSPSIIALLHRLFADRHGELAHALQRREWAAGLVQKLPPHERTDPDAWFHQLTQRVQLEKQETALLDLLRELREERRPEIDAVAVELAQLSDTPSASSPPPKRTKAQPSTKPTTRAKPPQAAPWHPVRVLHLSDLHFSAKTAWDSGTVFGRLAADVANLRAEVGEIHLVVVTGDVANFGTADEYAQATAWLTGPLATAAGVTPAQIRVVPGNHDVHRGSITRSASLLAKALLAEDDPQQAIAEVLSSETERAPLLTRQAAYLTFAQTFHPGLTVPWWSERPEIQGLTVHLAGLNSAWLSASNGDYGNLVLSRWQCNQLLAGAEGADLTIALMHHPWETLHEHDQESEEEIRRRCGVILNGHLHQQKARLASDPDRDVLQLAAGASYAGSRWANAYQLLELDPMRGEARVHFRVWDGHDWIPDRNRYQKAPDGVATLPLRRSPNAPKPPPDDDHTEDITDDPTPVRTPRERYAALLQGQLNKLPDVFRVGGGPRTIEAVYVEVTLAAHERELDCGADAPYAQGRRVSGKFIGGANDLHGRVPLSRVLAHNHRRWGLLGEPGGGKTTLLRHVATELLRDERGPLPIYLKVAELERGLPAAITTLCTSFATTDLMPFVLGEAQAGRAVLLIDGLDEAVNLPAARKWVAGAAELAGRSQVIVASRPIGYTEPSAVFRTLTICPLGDAEQTDLLTRWVPDRAKVTGALVRLSRSPRLRRLAENPLLLTLVGLLLRAGQDVPSRRGELYERALKLLLTRGHNDEDTAPGAPMREPDLTLELLGWAALRLHGLEGEAYRRDALISALEADARNATRLGKHWSSPAAFVAEVAERTGLLIPDTGRVRDATAYSFPHRTFREFLAAMALERDMGAVGAGMSKSRKSELSRVFAEGRARPERWAEVLALTCGRLGPGGADALVRRITKEGNRALLLRVVADAEGISAGTVRGTLNLERGWELEQLQARQWVIEEIPALVKDLAVAVGLLEPVAKSSTCGHDLYWVREVLRRIERGEVKGEVLDGSVEDAKRAAKGAAENVLSHLDLAKRAALLALLQPWWREIPAGSFDMGSDEYDPEKPIHRVRFTSGFQMLGVPVTWEMYRLFDPGHDAARDTFDGKLRTNAQDEVPVYNVSWYAAVMFAEWAGARLPSEPEWEYACRAGTKTRFWSGDTNEDLARVGWIDLNSDGHPHPVAQKPKNAWGLDDVHGNVSEWCADIYDAEAYAARTNGLTIDPRRFTKAVRKVVQKSAESAERSASRVLRGGSWNDWPEGARSAHRFRLEPSFTDRDVGLRLLLCPPERP
ncbi:SUMF1/EgtB/PvdO family nonheme iron enzyme [Myxococcota bacterium]|nr:SUMF1/EgtB/PvdO family nonheme iron enzyme [Myxococcota bacterium]